MLNAYFRICIFVHSFSHGGSKKYGFKFFISCGTFWGPFNSNHSLYKFFNNLLL